MHHATCTGMTGIAMKYAAMVLPFGFFFCSLSAYAQPGIPKSNAGTTAQLPAAAPTVAVPADAAAGAGASADPAPVQDLDPNYILGTDDAINVHVWKEPTISGPLVIRPDGRISLPLVGDVPATGMTPMALAAEISEQLKKFINDPSVTVTVTAVNSRKIFFIGEVTRSGPVPMTREMTMLQAISAAGGLTPYANKRKIYILRGEKGNQKKILFDYTKALKQGNQQGVELLPGDTIVVP
jgi:polysaccharide export outer membrane protein